MAEETPQLEDTKSRPNLIQEHLNITGRMAVLDNLFSEADIDIIGVQESRLPQTQILQTGLHGLQLWSVTGKAPRRRKSREEHPSSQSQIACRKNCLAMRASSR